jgi:hypothetical protein
LEASVCIICWNSYVFWGVDVSSPSDMHQTQELSVALLPEHADSEARNSHKFAGPVHSHHAMHDRLSLALASPSSSRLRRLPTNTNVCSSPIAPDAARRVPAGTWSLFCEHHAQPFCSAHCGSVARVRHAAAAPLADAAAPCRLDCARVTAAPSSTIRVLSFFGSAAHAITAAATITSRISRRRVAIAGLGGPLEGFRRVKVPRRTVPCFCTAPAPPGERPRERRRCACRCKCALPVCSASDPTDVPSPL